MSSFVHLHVHSHYSVLDGMSTISGLVDKASKSGMHAVALTDHGSMFGIKELFNYTKKKNGKVKSQISDLQKQFNAEGLSDNEKTDILKQIEEAQHKIFKPIIGVEAYVARRGRLSKEGTDDRSGYHLVLLAKNKKGYHNLCKLVSMSWIEGMYYRPLAWVVRYTKKWKVVIWRKPKNPSCGTSGCLATISTSSCNVTKPISLTPITLPMKNKCVRMTS